MKNFKKLLAFLLAGVMIVSLVGCGKDQTTDETPAQDEVIEDVPLMEIDGAAEEPVEEEPEVVFLTEDDLKDFVEFSNLYVHRQEEPVDPTADEDILDTDEAVEGAESEETEEVTPEDEAKEGEDGAAEDTEDAPDASEEIDIDPYGYIAAVNIKDPLVVREIAYDDTLVDVYTQGDYELFYLAVVDEDAYNESLFSPDVSEEPDADESTEDENVSDDGNIAEEEIEETEASEEEELLPKPENIIYGQISKVVRVLEPETYDEMLADGDIVEVVSGTAVLAPESEIEEIDIEDVEFSRPEGYTDTATADDYTPSYKNSTNKLIDVPKTSSGGSAGGTNSSNTNSGNISDVTNPETNTKAETPTVNEQPETTTKPTSSTTTTTPTTTTASTPTATPHVHSWVTETVSDGYYESQKTGTKQVQVGTKTVTDSAAWDEWDDYVICRVCGKRYETAEDWGCYDPCGGGYSVESELIAHHDAVTHQEPVYETQDVYEDVWVDTSYTIERCSTCGATK